MPLLGMFTLIFQDVQSSELLHERLVVLDECCPRTLLYYE
jgi:hypothetical protein